MSIPQGFSEYNFDEILHNDKFKSNDLHISFKPFGEIFDKIESFIKFTAFERLESRPNVMIVDKRLARYLLLTERLHSVDNRVFNDKYNFVGMFGSIYVFTPSVYDLKSDLEGNISEMFLFCLNKINRESLSISYIDQDKIIVDSITINGLDYNTSLCCLAQE